MESHYKSVLAALARGRLVPFFGAGVNLSGRPSDLTWKAEGSAHLPSGNELAEHLAETYGYPTEASIELARVSQYVAITNGAGPLYEDLHHLFDADYPPTSVHQFFARLPEILRTKRYRNPHQLVVSTNYDDLMEQAYRERGEPFDLVCYQAEGEMQGRFVHCTADGDWHVIEKPNEYRGLSLEKRPVVLKIHGEVNRANPERDSFVITEDDYIDYLTRTDLAALVPTTLAMHLRRSQFLFLGYSLRDWNLRVILHRIWGKQRLKYKSWAIQLHADVLDQQFWKARDVDILDAELSAYIDGLKGRVETMSSGT